MNNGFKWKNLRKWVFCACNICINSSIPSSILVFSTQLYLKFQILLLRNMKLLLSLLLLSYTWCYIEFPLVRVPHQTNTFNFASSSCLQASSLSNKQSQDKKQEESEDDDLFEEICYEKDMAYAIKLYRGEEIFFLAIDFTAPISWIKAEECHLAGSSKSCSRLQQTLGQQLKSIQKKLSSLLSKQIKKHKKKKHDQTALMSGSSEIVKGLMEKEKNLTFQIRDSGRLTRIGDLLLLGLGFFGEKDIMKLKNTTFIQGREISPHLNYLCDGAVSLRFDDDSQKSFLSEIVQYGKNTNRYVTVSLNKNNSLTIGDLSVKNSANGLSGIRWLRLQSEQKFGKLLTLQSFGLTRPDFQKQKTIQSDIQVVITLSSSSISIPQNQLNSIIDKFFKYNHCEINSQNRYVECAKLKNDDLQKEINFIFEESTLEIALKDLVIEASHSKTKLNLKKSLDSRFLILGEPLFKKYFFVFDYTNNRIGFSDHRTHYVDEIINVVTLIRFVLWILILFCVLIICAGPVHTIYRVVTRQRHRPFRRKKYEPVNQNYAVEQRIHSSTLPIE